MTERSGRGMAGLRSLGRGVGWIVTCCLIGLGVARGVFDVSPSNLRPLTSVDLGPFAAQQVSGAWFDTARSTRLYAVTGQLVNESAEPRVPGSALRAALVSAAGARLDRPAAPAGALLAEADLRELPAAELDQLRSRSAARLAETRLEPGESVPFLAYFDSVPGDATGFVIEMDAVPDPLPPEPPLEAGLMVPEMAPGMFPGDGQEMVPGDGQAMGGPSATTPTSAAPVQPSQQPLPR